MANSPPQHYELPDLIDYVRQTAPPDRLAEIWRHIEVEGCERCRRSASMLADAYGASRMLARVEVPDAVVQRARSIFQPQPAASSVAWWKRLPAVAAQLVVEGGPAPLRRGYGPRGPAGSASTPRGCWKYGCLWTLTQRVRGRWWAPWRTG